MLQRSIPRRLRQLIVLACLPSLLLSGCHRSMYRQEADAQAYCLIGEKISPECWPIPNYTIEPRPESRMFDPFDRDFPPMPPDDPTSHQFMHEVNCQDGYGCWHINGDTQSVENPSWWELLPRTETGAVAIDSLSAIQLALTHSPVYQSELEEVYLSALDVSFQRFQFDVQYFGGFSSFLTQSGRDRTGTGQSSTQFEINTFSGRGGNRLLSQQLTASGGQLAVGFANSLIWELSGANMHSASSLLDFSIVQPLLRGAGRDVILEGLTQSERTLLANVRAMERFRREFYVEIIAGRSAGGGPGRGGPSISGFTNSGGGGGGFLGLLQTQQNIRNQRANIAALQSSVAQLEAFFLAGRIDYFQVEFARQALYSAQSNLLSAERNLQFTLDQFKLTLGLPPGIDLDISETLIEPFQLVDPEIVPLQDKLTRLQQVAGQTLGRLYERVILPSVDAPGDRGELPAPGDAAKQKAAAEKIKDPAAEDEDEDDNPLDRLLGNEAGDEAKDDSLLDDPDELADGELPDPNSDDQDDEDPADADPLDDEDATKGASLEWSDEVASALQSIKQDIKSARDAIKQANSRHIEFAGEDIGQLRQSLQKRNRDANMLRKQLVERIREDRARRDLQKSQNGTTADDYGTVSLEKGAGDEVTDEDIGAYLPYRPDRLKQLPIVLEDTIADIIKQLKLIDEALEEIDAEVDKLLEGGEELSPEELFKEMQTHIFVRIPSELNRLAAAVLSITLVQARARTESISIPSVDLEWENAVSLARCNRLDWMNARADIVDTWRQVQVTANDLESQLDVIVDGDIGNVGDNGLDFRASTGRLRMGIQFDSPITRLSERNVYRESLIDYQRSRRSYYQFEDQVTTSVRDIIRRLEVNQINFELQRAAVDVAISQVELARLRLQEPPRPGEASGFGATTARDLVQALSGLLNAQNQFLGIWVNQEVLRRSLDLDLGTMQLDGRSLWVDPGSRLGLNEGDPGVDTSQFDDPDFGPDVGPEEIEAPQPDEPAQFSPLPDVELTEPLPLPAIPATGSTRPSLLDSLKSRRFQPSPIQPVTYNEPIIDADSQSASPQQPQEPRRLQAIPSGAQFLPTQR